MVGSTIESIAVTGQFYLENVATQLNIAMRGGDVDQEAVEGAVPVVREALSADRRSAAQGSYSFGTPIADIAAGLILYADASALWIDLADFLTDTAIPRLSRSSAFERLARELSEVPYVVKALFVDRATAVLEAPDHFSESEIVPYPEALRFFGSHGLIGDVETLDLTARLAGMSGRGRQEAARTIAALSRKISSPWLLAFATQLSHDEDVEARANAGRCLAQLARSSSTVADFSSSRLVDLLKEDGLLVPVLVLRGLEEWGSGLPADVRAQIEQLREVHPSRAVRRQAARFLDNA
jgi:hypothetical protein